MVFLDARLASPESNQPMNSWESHHRGTPIVKGALSNIAATSKNNVLLTDRMLIPSWTGLCLRRYDTRRFMFFFSHFLVPLFSFSDSSGCSVALSRRFQISRATAAALCACYFTLLERPPLGYPTFFFHDHSPDERSRFSTFQPRFTRRTSPFAHRTNHVRTRI